MEYLVNPEVSEIDDPTVEEEQAFKKETVINVFRATALTKYLN